MAWESPNGFKEKTKRKLTDGKTVEGRGNRLSDCTIKQLQEYYCSAITTNINKTAKTTEEVNEAIEKYPLYHARRFLAWFLE